LSAIGESVEMIDLHNHILPGLDDGARTSEESMQMCRISYRDGVRTIVATHTLARIKRPIRHRLKCAINEAIETFGVRSSEIGVQNPKSEIKSSDSKLRTHHSELPFKILPGADVHLCEKTLPHFDQGRLTTINDGGKFLLVEFPSQGIPYRAEEVLFQLMARGIIPVITHPERNQGIGQNPKRYDEMIRAGCLGQVTAMSVTGEFGPKVKKVAEQLLRNRLVHFIASDAHSANGRPPVLSQREGGRSCGRRSPEMVTEYPRRSWKARLIQNLVPDKYSREREVIESLGQ
jgi:protein-tyrosine phosphatase